MSLAVRNLAQDRTQLFLKEVTGVDAEASGRHREALREAARHEAALAGARK